MRRGAHLRGRGSGGEDDRPSFPPLATGIVLGLWTTGMVVLALVVVPTLFAMCAPPR